MQAHSRHLDASVAERLGRARDLRVAGRLDAAEAVLRRLLARDPSSAAAHDHLGRTHQARGRLAAAIDAYRRALELDPKRAEAHLQLGLAYEQRGAGDVAAACYRRAAALDDDSPLPLVNLGILALAAGRTAHAIGRFRAAVERAPGFPLAHQQLAYALLQNGQLAEGFRELEWRFEQGGVTPRQPGTTAPVWDGRRRPDDTLLIFCEQGYGTRMQLIRYAALAARRVGRVLCLAGGPEARLLATCPGVAGVYTAHEPLPRFDLQVPLASLPGIFGTTLDTVPSRVPYLKVPDGVRADAELPGDGTGLRVGFVWASGERYRGPCRDAPLEAFARLAAISGVRLFSFQFDPRRDALERLDADVVDLGSRLGDFARTAAYVERMDLILTVDTAMAHLAGALGKPTWLLLAKRADWRWLDGRDDSPWYPTLRLYRQRRAGGWAEVFRRVARDLRGRHRMGG